MTETPAALRRWSVSRGARLLVLLHREQHSGSDRRCVKVGLLFAAKFFSVRNPCVSVATVLLSAGVVFVGLLLSLATPAHAQSARYGSRAGSNFSDTSSHYGRISKRPNRRRSSPVALLSEKSLSEKSSPTFDYRLDESDEALEVSSLASHVDFESSYVEQAGYCDCTGDCQCDNGIVERGCGCVDDCVSGFGGGGSCEPGCGCEENYGPACGCDNSYEPSCGCDSCAGGEYLGGCDSSGGGYASCSRGGRMSWNVGFEWSFVKPRFSENVAYTTMTGDGANNSTFIDTEFDYDLELTPRVWLEAGLSKNWSWRLSYWQFDHSPDLESTSPNANGFGEITHPSFADVDISTTIPTDTFFASSKLNAYTIDLEALKQARLCGWQLGVGGGLRYASVEQEYFSQLRNTGNVLRGQIDFSQALEGIGPTVSLSARRPLLPSVQLVCAARGSLLFGNGSSSLAAGEDLDLANPFSTTRLTSRDDHLPISEARVGIEWLSPKKHSRSWQWMLSTAMEGQYWGNAGNASSETADLGFFGFNFGAGFLR